MYRNVRHRQPADARVWSPAGRHNETKRNLIAPRRIPERHLRRAEMTAHITRVDVAQWDHEARARASDGLGRRHNRLGLTEHLTHALAAGFVPDGAVFEFPVFTDDDALAVGFDV